MEKEMPGWSESSLQVLCCSMASGICVCAGGKDSLNYLECSYLYVSHFFKQRLTSLSSGRVMYHHPL